MGICLREGLGVERSDGWEVLSCCRGARCLLETVQLGEERVDVLQLGVLGIQLLHRGYDILLKTKDVALNIVRMLWNTRSRHWSKGSRHLRWDVDVVMLELRLERVRLLRDLLGQSFHQQVVVVGVHVSGSVCWQAHVT